MQVNHRELSADDGTSTRSQEPLNDSLIPRSAESTDDPSTQQQQIVGFDESTPSQEVHFNPILDNSFYTDYTAGGDLADFLARPVPISELTWNLGNFPKTEINPWELFFDDVRIKKKIDNYAFLSCNLHVKVVVNSSQFLYGALMMAYTPLPTIAPTIHSVIDLERVAYSQRPHINIYPHRNEGGSMCLPFVQQNNWLRVNVKQDFTDMGKLTFLDLAPLASANDALSGEVNLTIYAWATDVRITGATVQLSMQSGKAKKKISTGNRNNKEKTTPADEYGQGVVSKPASAVARFAGHLEQVPVIGPFATATKIGASAVAKVASLFGYTNVPVIEDTRPVKSLSYHGLASAEISDPVEKLTLDPKNELCIDPRTVGLAPQDELDLTYLVTRESYVTQFTWNETDVSNQVLFSTIISPAYGAIFPLIPQEVFQMGPLAHFSQLFKYWRGDIILRFRFVCSPYHKGRVRFTWDPIGELTDANSTTVTYTKIVDINEDTNFEIRIPYQQRQAFLLTHEYKTLPTTNVYSDLTTPVTASPIRDNGALSVRVLNTLVSPTATNSPIQVLVYARGADNFEFADPIGNLDEEFSTFQLQSATTKKNISIVSNDHDVSDPSQYLVYMGENVKSLRTFLRRSCLSEVIVSPEVTSGDRHAIYTFTSTKFPGAPGYDPKGTRIANSLNLPQGPNQPYNYVKQTPFTWIVPCYLGMRGSMIWHYNAVSHTLEGSKALGTVRLDRRSGSVGTEIVSGVLVTKSASVVTYTNNSTNQLPRFYSINVGSGIGGMSLTNQLTQAGISVLKPHYNAKRFIAADPAYWRRGRAAEESSFHVYQLEIPMHVGLNPNLHSRITLEKYHSIGTDFSVFFFLGAPAIYWYKEVPNAL